MDGVKLDVFFPGFPTLKHISHRSDLKAIGVRVFEQASRGANMTLVLSDQGRPDIAAVAQELLGQEIWVGWPHMVEAKVTKISDKDGTYVLSDKGTMVREPEDSRKSDFATLSRGVSERYLITYSMQLSCRSKLYILVSLSLRQIQISLRDHHWSCPHPDSCMPNDWKKGRQSDSSSDLRKALNFSLRYPFSRFQYVCGHKGRITLEKQWSRFPQVFALQTTRKDILVHDPSFTQYRTLGELFPENSFCFMLGQPHYGCKGKVAQISPEHKGRILLEFDKPKVLYLRKKKSSHFVITVFYFVFRTLISAPSFD